MEIKININEEQIQGMVEELIAKEIVREYGTIARDAKYGVRDGMDKAVKAYIYSRKEEIIEKCVNRAAAELVRKGLPKLLERGIEK
jgi:hypothetical protein